MISKHTRDALRSEKRAAQCGSAVQCSAVRRLITAADAPQPAQRGESKGTDRQTRRMPLRANNQRHTPAVTQAVQDQATTMREVAKERKQP
jgi:hypothetical protein